MKVLIVHNSYKQPGGEDIAAAQEAKLLRNAGHQVAEYHRSNDETDSLGFWDKARSAKRMIWSSESTRDLRLLIAHEKPDLVHFHNTFFMISPSAYYICQKMGVAVVQTLHNYRLLCPNALFLKNGMVCERCLGKTPPWPGVLHGCWQASRLNTLGVATMLTVHRLLDTWNRQIDQFIALSSFAQGKFIQGGLPDEKIRIKPNFVHTDPGPGEADGNYAIFVGRFWPFKRMITLLDAWRDLRGIPLKIAGGGREANLVTQMIKKFRIEDIELMGFRPHEEVFPLLKNARFLVFPTECYEGFPMTIAEAFASGVPVVASRLGSIEEIVEDGRTGLLFSPGDAEDLARKVQWAWTHEKEMRAMGKEGRREYETKYTAERNYQMLVDIYHLALARRVSRK
jgi:glycosyltransferase involved in cell wall biosynthesis